MLRCKRCGYENNDGSHICLNCRENLDDVERSASESELYIQMNQAAIKEADERVKRINKTTLIVILSLVAAGILGVVVYFANLYKPVVDDNLLGTWQFAGYGYTEIWTFEKDGTYSMTRSGTGIFSEELNIDWYYRAEDGKLRTSWSKDVNNNISVSYEYQFGVSENGTRCLILKQIQGGGSNTYILTRVN